jgi:hypothetical protein
MNRGSRYVAGSGEALSNWLHRSGLWGLFIKKLVNTTYRWKTRKDSKAGYILFTPAYSFAVPMKKMDVQAVIECENGYMKVWMGEAYTIRMLAQELWELAQRQWEFYPINGYRRWIDGSVFHKTTWDYNEYLAVVADDSMSIPPAKTLEERGRGTTIPNSERVVRVAGRTHTPIV